MEGYTLDFDAAAAIARHLELDVSKEHGGLLGGLPYAKHIHIVRLVPNSADDPARHFSIAPADQLMAVKGIEESGFELMGSFHSHPDGRDQLSGDDRLTAEGLGLSLVVGVGTANWKWGLFDPAARGLARGDRQTGRVPLIVRPPRTSYLP